MCLDRVPLLLLSCLIVITSASPQDPPAFLKNTFFGGGNRIAVPTIPASISQPALNAPAFSPFQASFSRPQLPAGSPLRASLSGRTPALAIQRQPLQSFTQFSSPVPVSPPRLGKAIESRPISKPQQPPATFNQFSSGPGVSQPRFENSLDQALDQAAKSAQFSLPENSQPGLNLGGSRQEPGLRFSTNQFSSGTGVSPPRFENSLDQALDQASKSAQFSLPEDSPPRLTNLGGSRQEIGLQFSSNAVQTFPERVKSSSLLPSDNPNLNSSPLEGPSATFNQLAPRTEVSPESLQISLGKALDAASKSASFSVPQSSLSSQTRDKVNFDQPRQELGSQFPQPSRINLDQALTKASNAAAASSGLSPAPQLANIGPVIPAVPAVSKHLVKEARLGGQTPGSFQSPNIFRENSKSKSSSFTRKLPLEPQNQAGPPVFGSSPQRNGFNKPEVFRSDPKNAENRFRQGGSSPIRKSSPVKTLSGSTIHRDSSPAKACKKIFREECHNEYTMVCEDTFTEREKYECNTVEETKCEKGYTTEYEPACFQQILEHCENMCKRGIQPDCTPQCARSLGKTSCHKVKVVTPHNTCTKVPKEVCGNVKKRVPYEKCHDIPRKVCEKIPREVCN